MSLTLTRHSTTRPGVRARAVAQVLHVGPLSLKFITLLIAAVITLFYLAQSTQSATNAYNIRALDIERSKLRDEADRLQVEALRLKALNNLKESTKDLGLEPINPQ